MPTAKGEENLVFKEGARNKPCQSKNERTPSDKVARALEA